MYGFVYAPENGPVVKLGPVPDAWCGGIEFIRIRKEIIATRHTTAATATATTAVVDMMYTWNYYIERPGSGSCRLGKFRFRKVVTLDSFHSTWSFHAPHLGLARSVTGNDVINAPRRRSSCCRPH